MKKKSAKAKRKTTLSKKALLEFKKNSRANKRDVVEIDSEPMSAFIDHNSKTCILISHSINCVRYIDLNSESGLSVNTATTTEFTERFTKMDYPSEKICEKYLKFALKVGATNEALDCLGTKIEISKKEIEMANAKKNTTAAGSNKNTVKKETASQLFQKLIMEGKLTDDQIFAAVQKAFPEVPDKRRCYVTEYRSILNRKGKNPPKALVDPKIAKEKEATKKAADKIKADKQKLAEKTKADKQKAADKVKADKEKAAKAKAAEKVKVDKQKAADKKKADAAKKKKAAAKK